MTKALFIKQIEQKNNHVFSILWNDGQMQFFRLSDLQKICPCANCRDENTGKRLVDINTIPDNLKALSIRNVGHYAMKIYFTSGCSLGIFSYEMLKNMS